jgi:hypothetical protein
MDKMGATGEMHEWRRYYQAALLETDPAQLLKLIRQAEIAIDARIEQLRDSQAGNREEKDAIAEALAGLNVLRKEVKLAS